MSIPSLQTMYDQMWQEAHPSLSQGNIEGDPHLSGRSVDSRYGWTLIARPSAEVQQEFQRFLKGMPDFEPNQHYYHPESFHFTVLTLITGSPQWASYQARIPRYYSVLKETFVQMDPITIQVRGITATRSCVMAQGFPEADQLNRIRDRLRAVLHEHQLGDTLDQRYRIRLAHCTLMRFTQPLSNGAAFLEYLQPWRDFDFGTTHVKAIQFVFNDWYMSPEKVKLLAEYQLVQAL